MFQSRFHDNLDTRFLRHEGSFNVTNSFNRVDCGTWNRTTDHDRSDILAWLSPQEPRLRHGGIRERRVENVGEWVLHTEEFKSWCAGSGKSESDTGVLFCYGDPGVGKTFISSLVIDRLCGRAVEHNAAVACFYCDFTARKDQSPANMLGTVLRQLVGGLAEIPGEIEQEYRDYKRPIGGRRLQLDDILRMLQTAVSKKPTFICIDGLDECVEKYRTDLLNSLNQVLQKSPATRVFLTGRPQMQADVERGLSGRAMTIRITPRKPDIISYLHCKLGEDVRPDAMDSDLEADILKKIPEEISEIFLLVSLKVDTILEETTLYRRRQKLNAITDGSGLEGAYSQALSRIKGQDGEKSRLGMAALMWISHSERPLKVDELCHALGVEIGSTDLDSDNVPSIRTLITCCQGYVSVDKETSTARLIHRTLREHLRGRPQLFNGAHSTMAETCLSYLNSHQVKALSDGPSRDLCRTPFLEYSSLYWGVHAKRDLSDCAKQLVLKLFEDYGNHISTEILLREEKPEHFDLFFDELVLFSHLHCASFFGIVEIVTLLVEAGSCDINQRDCIGSTPLVWAALNGHEGAMKILLGQDDINPNTANGSGETPLCCAAKNGHEAVVKILLGQDDIDPNRASGSGETPLWWAAKNGHKGVLEILLRRNDVNPDKPDKDGRTPLWCAAEIGQAGVVKMLLELGGVNLNKPDKYGATPLWCAASSGHEEVVKILLGRDHVNPDESDNSGKTPLMCASQNGHEGVVKILLERGDAIPEKPGSNGETLLLCADDGGAGTAAIHPRGDADHPHEPRSDRRNPHRRAAKRALARIRALLRRPKSATPGAA